MTPDLQAVLEKASSVRVTKVGAFNPRSRGRVAPIIVVRDAPSIEALRRSLVVDEKSLTEQYAWMTPSI